MVTKRNTGLDLYRIACCMGVLGYHVLDDILGFGWRNIAGIPYFACSFCVPGFFLLSGYLCGSRKEMTLDYCEKKILLIVKKLTGWVLFWSILEYFWTGWLPDILSNLTGTIHGSGNLPVAWFLFTYCLILLFAPALWKVCKKFPLPFAVAAALWVGFLAFGKLDFIAATRAQSQWLHLYLGYFVCGVALAQLYDRVVRHHAKKYWLAGAVALFALSTAVYFYVVFVRGDHGNPAGHYNKWYYALWLLSMFAIFLCIEMQNPRLVAILKTASANTFAVYLGHLPVWWGITAVHPLHSVRKGLMYMVMLFLLWQLLAELFKKLPLLRKIV